MSSAPAALTRLVGDQADAAPVDAGERRDDRPARTGRAARAGRRRRRRRRARCARRRRGARRRGPPPRPIEWDGPRGRGWRPVVGGPRGARAAAPAGRRPSRARSSSVGDVVVGDARAGLVEGGRADVGVVDHDARVPFDAGGCGDVEPGPVGQHQHVGEPHHERRATQARAVDHCDARHHARGVDERLGGPSPTRRGRTPSRRGPRPRRGPPARRAGRRRPRRRPPRRTRRRRPRRSAAVPLRVPRPGPGRPGRRSALPVRAARGTPRRARRGRRRWPAAGHAVGVTPRGRRSSAALWPPNPNEVDSAGPAPTRRGSPATTSTGRSQVVEVRGGRHDAGAQRPAARRPPRRRRSPR